MELKQRFVVAHPRDAVWSFFGRMEDVTLCMPGASLSEPPADNRAKFKLNVKLGPISAAFVGDAEVDRNSADYRGVIRGNARDSRGDSRVKGSVNYALTPEADGHSTAVDIDVDFALTGRLAQFSRGGIVSDLAARLTEQFAGNLERALTATATGPSGATKLAGPTVAVGRDAAQPPRSVPAAELHAGRLIFSVIWSRVKALLRSIFGR